MPSQKYPCRVGAYVAIKLSKLPNKITVAYCNHPDKNDMSWADNVTNEILEFNIRKVKATN